MKTNESFSNLGLNEFKMNVTSNMKLIKTSSEFKIMENLNNLLQKIKLELYKNENTSSLVIKEGNETEEKSFNESLISLNDVNYTNNESILNHTNAKLRNLETNNNINFVSSYISSNKLLYVSFLGLYVGLHQNLYINHKTGLRRNYVNLVIGNKEYTLSTVNLYQYYYSGEEYKIKEVVDTYFALAKDFKPFGYLIKEELNLKCSLYHGVYINVINGEMYTKGFVDIDLAVGGRFRPYFLYTSFGVSMSGKLAKGNSYIQANTLLNQKSYLTRFIFYRDIKSSGVDIEFCFIRKFLFHTDKYRSTYHIFKGFLSYLSYCKYY